MTDLTDSYDAIIIGAGAAGLFCAGRASQQGLRILLIEHAPKLAEKIRISGGGRCNFTNFEVSPANFVSANPAFCRSALARYTPQDFIGLVQKHNIPYHEKHRGQLFCDRRAEDIIQMLTKECDLGHVERRQPCSVNRVSWDEPHQRYRLSTTQGEAHSEVSTRQLVIATGGLSIPKIGATDFGLRIATQFGHSAIPPRPALVPLTFEPVAWAPYASLAGLSREVAVSIGTGKKAPRFVEDLLFTHRGLSGPAILQISSHWETGQSLRIDLSPHLPLAAKLRADKIVQHRKSLVTILGGILPQRMAQLWLSELGPRPALAPLAQRPLAEIKDKELDCIAQSLHEWVLTPTSTEGWNKAEVMRGGIDTREINSQSMQSQRQQGMYFIGEVLDVTGWLGGYNFQWAWASAAACAQALVLNHVAKT